MQNSMIFRKRESVATVFTFLFILTTALYLTGCKCNDKGGSSCGELSVTMEGTGSGRVTSMPDGIYCEQDCSEDYINGSLIKLSAASYSGSTFTGWTGGNCSGTGPCIHTMAGDTTVAANFSLISTDISDLITPYVNELDIKDIRNGFSTIKTDPQNNPPWGFVHDGFDIYPDGDLKPFQAICSGRVQWIYTGDEQVIVILACNSKFSAEYNFETQAANTGQIQLANIMVVEGQTVSQGEIIGRLYTPNDRAHVHFSLYKHWIPTCPEPYLSQAASTSMLNLLQKTYSTSELCYGGNVTPPPLVTPYVTESDMTKINAGFSSIYSSSPWDFVHDGFDIYPQGNLRPFQAACAGKVDSVELRQPHPGANWQVEVLIQCENYVNDPDSGGYFIPFSVDYIFEPMSKVPADGQTQLANIAVSEGQAVAQGDPIGYLSVAGVGAHVQFGLRQFGSSDFSSIGVTSIPLCPEPHFSTSARDSMLDLLHVVWPSANMCYQN